MYITFAIPTGSDGREVLRIERIPVEIFLTCQYMQNNRIKINVIG